jgi:hypothetical protein
VIVEGNGSEAGLRSNKFSPKEEANMPFKKTFDFDTKEKAVNFVDLFIGDDEVTEIEVVKKDPGPGYEGTFTIT